MELLQRLMSAKCFLGSYRGNILRTSQGSSRDAQVLRRGGGTRSAEAGREFRVLQSRRGYGGHTQNLALFEATNRWLLETKSEGLSPAETTLHHIALNVALEDFESEKTRLEGLGLKVNATVHEWLHVRSLYFSDPERNLLEFVCYDASMG